MLFYEFDLRQALQMILASCALTNAWTVAAVPRPRVVQGRLNPDRRSHQVRQRSGGLACLRQDLTLQDHFSQEFGARWSQLFEALQRPKSYAAWANSFVEAGEAVSVGGSSSAAQVLSEHGLTRLSGSAAIANLWIPARGPGVSQPLATLDGQLLPKPPTCPHTGLKLYYPFDLASALPVMALLTCIQPGSRVFDACAAPGGKFLILAGALLAGRLARGAGQRGGSRVGRLVAMERDRFRLSRLKQNLHLYLPPEALAHAHAVGGDATRPHVALCSKQSFDAVLVDAPCSSERERLLRAARQYRVRAGNGAAVVPRYAVGGNSLETQAIPWDAKRAQSNARRQVAMVKAAIQNCAPHGCVVYSTCALSRIENDDVIGEILRDVPDGWRCFGGSLGNEGHGGVLLPREAHAEIEELRYGYRLLPDRGGWGPIYWSVLRGPKA